MKKFCCDQMEKQITLACEKHEDEYACPDVLIDYSDIFDEYGIIIHDGGCSSITINFCPWCGKKLPESKRDLWFDTLEKLGYEDPFDQDIPEKYKSDAWYSK